MKEFLPVLRASQLFAGICEAELTAMLACLDPRTERFAKDAILLRIGDAAESIGLVLSGSVLIIQEDIWGNRSILSKAGPGQTFAAAYACAPGSLLNVSVAAETPVTAMFFSVRRVLTVCPSACEHHSRIIRNLLGELAEKICALAKSSRTWPSARRARSSCPTSPPKPSASAAANSTAHSPASSWPTPSRSSAAACRSSSEK